MCFIIPLKQSYVTVTNQALYFCRICIHNVLAPWKQFTGENSSGDSGRCRGRECSGQWRRPWESAAREWSILQAQWVSRLLWCGREGTSMTSLVWFIIVYMYTMIRLTQSCLHNSRTAVLLRPMHHVLQFLWFDSTSLRMRIMRVKRIRLISLGL